MRFFTWDFTSFSAAMSFAAGFCNNVWTESTISENDQKIQVCSHLRLFASSSGYIYAYIIESS